ncbi:beta-lactamase family protein [Burkholderiaceae bacterium FT117]|uniref:serine hydrolase domain-containing protein n=1 Tax=Zeimonas sediminis TaxID=2944268 RepID=UPI002342C914|nr:serine hydrolase domain-containing protein [Zeimonas sediminis]MCM5571439.1 beta-lactamase family protein [Zeimonas sediminis]
MKDAETPRASSPFDEAIAFAIASETPWSRNADGDFGIHQLDPAPWNRTLGPLHDRGPVSGVIRVDGREVASWGEPHRADLTFSVAKTYLALLAGVAFDRGLLPDPDEPVRARARGIGFDEGRNREITWTHLLQQTSEWEGECFGVPDQVDRYRTVQYQKTPAAGRKGDARPLQAPGSFWEYNDVRINQLSLALLHLFRAPLPEVFDEAIRKPSGASDPWRWVGYDDSWVEIDGRRIQSVPGGSHWGGGVSISARDQGLIGQMLADDGVANGRRVLSSEWIARMRTPCALAPFYGMLVWLNGTQDVFPSAGGKGYFAIGAGASVNWIDPERRLVAVVRWIDGAKIDGFVGRVAAALGR